MHACFCSPLPHTNLEQYVSLKYLSWLRTEVRLGPRLPTYSLQGHSSRLAALDYTVCVQSEVFVTTQGGNFPHFLMGHRRYLFRGNSKTIKPDKRKLVLSFDDPNIR